MDYLFLVNSFKKINRTGLFIWENKKNVNDMPYIASNGKKQINFATEKYIL